MPTLFNDALETVRATFWANTRSEAVSLCQGKAAIDALKALGLEHVEDVTQTHLRAIVARWTKAGVSPNTQRRRFAALNMMGVKVQGCRPKPSKDLKWWLNPNDKAKVLGWLRTSTLRDGHQRRELADHIEWTCYTGFRVEETQRLLWREVMFAHDDKGGFKPRGMYVNVPGTKTKGAAALLPLGEEAGAVLIKRRLAVGTTPPDAVVFPLSYYTLAPLWRECRRYLGADGNATATLKALRRSAARYLHVDRGMPLDVTRQYLRHADVQTTMGYLKLVGGYASEEMRRWL